jgi:hypothetical protein
MLMVTDAMNTEDDLEGILLLLPIKARAIRVVRSCFAAESTHQTTVSLHFRPASYFHWKLFWNGKPLEQGMTVAKVVYKAGMDFIRLKSGDLTRRR